jgi:hypothetical protein
MANDLLAVEDIRLAMAEKPRCLDLLSDLCGYFGSSLIFEKQPPEIKYGATHPSLDANTCLISIAIRAPTNKRLPAAIAHEMLHVKLIKDGFPIAVSLTWDSRISIDVFGDVGNFTDHAIILPEFLQLEFQPEEFFFNPDEKCDVLDRRKNNEALMAHPQMHRFARGDWNKLYFEHWMAREAGFQNQVDEIAFHGRQLFPNSMTDDIRAMESWYERGEFRSSGTYANAINELLTLIGFGPVEFMMTRMTPDGLRWIASQGGVSLYSLHAGASQH